jgi:hypothetical protein
MEEILLLPESQDMSRQAVLDSRSYCTRTTRDRGRRWFRRVSVLRIRRLQCVAILTLKGRKNRTVCLQTFFDDSPSTWAGDICYQRHCILHEASGAPLATYVQSIKGKAQALVEEGSHCAGELSAWPWTADIESDWDLCLQDVRSSVPCCAVFC